VIYLGLSRQLHRGEILRTPKVKLSERNHSHSFEIMEQVDVTIVGGGPTGLFVALLLQPLGISVRVLGKLH
jgi:ribulose 1,5-bisphosphate synthetase/thiazole synthase